MTQIMVPIATSWLQDDKMYSLSVLDLLVILAEARI